MSAHDKDGVMLQDQEQVKRRWKEYVEDIYHSRTGPMGWAMMRWMRGERDRTGVA